MFVSSSSWCVIEEQQWKEGERAVYHGQGESDTTEGVWTIHSLYAPLCFSRSRLFSSVEGWEGEAKESFLF